MKRAIYTVQPNRDARGWWDVAFNRPEDMLDSGRGYCGGGYRTKAAAVQHGRAQALDDWNRLRRPSQLRVKGRNGRIQFEHTYGKDPRRFQG